MQRVMKEAALAWLEQRLESLAVDGAARSDASVDENAAADLEVLQRKADQIVVLQLIRLVRGIE